MNNKIEISIRINNDDYQDSKGRMLVEHNDDWEQACKELSYDAFKLYIFFIAACEYDADINPNKQDEIYGCTVNGEEFGISNVNQALYELIDAGYIHFFGAYQFEDGLHVSRLWDFFVHPISESKYISSNNAIN